MGLSMIGLLCCGLLARSFLVGILHRHLGSRLGPFTTGCPKVFAFPAHSFKDRALLTALVWTAKSRLN